jgi:hypothetical protein
MATPNSKTSEKSAANLITKLPALIKQDITICCSGDEPGDMYIARVLTVNESRLDVSLPRRIAGKGFLRKSQPVILNFVIGNTLYEAPAEYKADNNHTRELVIYGDIKQTSRRHYPRHRMQIRAGYVPVSDMRLSEGHFANLRWQKCMTIDLSAGGALLQIPIQAPVNSFLLMNLEIPSFEGPLFVFSQVRWFGLGDTHRRLYLCGIRFLLREELPNHFSRRALSELPPIMLPFDKNKQIELDAHLNRQSGDKKQGESNDDK